MLSAKMEDYLKAIYELQRESDEPVATSHIAELLDVTAPTATSMMETLADHGLVEREKYRGVRLTPEGETVALEVVRHHRLLETYLTEELGYDWAEVHDEADRLEHHISERLETEIDAVLGEPTADPHGAPIPSADLEVLDEDLAPLSAHEEGDLVTIERVRDDDPEVLAYLDRVGVTPGARFRVAEIAPFEMVTLAPLEAENRTDDAPSTEASGETVSLPKAVAVTVSVREANPKVEDGPALAN